jgi:excisionase family DNA binding protein
MEPLYTTHEISAFLQMDPSTIAKWINKGLLAAFRTPGGHRRVRATDLRTFLLAHQMPIPKELGGESVSLVVVDDEKPVLDAIKRAFKPFAAQTTLTFTTSGVEGLLLVADLKPHGLLLDLCMDELDGLEVCRRIRAQKSLAAVKIITMTGRYTEQLVRDCAKAGAVGCLAKPVDPEVVLRFFGVSLSAT